MIDQIQYFQKGVVYRIKNKKTNHCLALCSKRDLKAIEEQDSCDQLWIIRQIKGVEYQIEHFKVGSVMTFYENKKVYTVEMKKDKVHENQLWSIILGESVDSINYFWIKPSLNLGVSLCSSSYNEIIKMSEIDHTLNICLWEFIPYQQLSTVLKILTTIKSESSKMILTVPDYSSKQGTNLIQISFCGGGNQRWLVQSSKDCKEESKQYTIRNYSSGLHLTASYSKGISKVIQSIYNNHGDQKWNLLNVSNNIFLIQSVSNPNYYLGVINDKGGSPIYLLQDKMKARWIFEGYFPAL